jgi:hypothetical protein
MVFMGAATFRGNVPLVDAAMADIAEMEFIGSGKTLDVFVQIHHGGNSVPKRRHLGHGKPDDVPRGQRNPGNGSALESFIRWSMDESDSEPKDRYTMLVLWGHAYDFAFGREHTSRGTIDALDFAELSGVLERLQERPKAYGEPTLDIVGFDACDIATVEIARQFQSCAKYLLGSQIGIPIPGWPYDRILDRLKNPKDRLMGPAEFGSYVLRRFCESYEAVRPVSLTLLDLKHAVDLSDHTEVLSNMIARSIEEEGTSGSIADLFVRSQTDRGKPYVDVADLCLTLARESGDAYVTAAATALGDFLISPSPPTVGESLLGGGRPLIVDHSRNAGNTARLNGISLYAPHVAPQRNFAAVRDLYQKFVFAQETSWSALVHGLARSV